MATQSAKTAAQVARAIADALEGRKIPYAFFRRKDLADAEAVLRDQGTALDRRKVRNRLVKLVGEEDERVRSWDDLAGER